PGRDLRGQHLLRADDRQPPRIARRGQLVDHVRDDLQQRLHLFVRTVADVVGGEQEQRDDLDARLPAPRQEVLDALGADAVTTVDVGEARFTGPPAVAVENDADVAGMLPRGLLLQPPRVEAVHDLGGERPKTHVQAAYACPD